MNRKTHAQRNKPKHFKQKHSHQQPYGETAHSLSRVNQYCSLTHTRPGTGCEIIRNHQQPGISIWCALKRRRRSDVRNSGNNVAARTAYWGPEI